MIRILLLSVLLTLCSLVKAGDTLTVHSKTDKRIVAYHDSLTLYNNFIQVRSNLLKAGYTPVKRSTWEDSGEISMEEIATYVDKQILPPNPKNRDRYQWITFNRILSSKEGNLYKTLDFFPLSVHNEIGFQYFSLIIKPRSVQEYGFRGYKDPNDMDGRLLYEYMKPTITVLYKEYQQKPVVAKVAPIETKKVAIIYTTRDVGGDVKVDSTKRFKVSLDYAFK